MRRRFRKKNITHPTDAKLYFKALEKLAVLPDGLELDGVNLIPCLIVIAVEHRELLLTVRCHVCGVNVERYAVRQFAVVLSWLLFDTGRYDSGFQTFKHARRNAIGEPRQRRL